MDEHSLHWIWWDIHRNGCPHTIAQRDISRKKTVYFLDRDPYSFLCHIGLSRKDFLKIIKLESFL
jgi:hypothetical protein